MFFLVENRPIRPPPLLVENSTNFFFLKPSLSQKELGSIYGVKIVMSVYYSYKKVIIICMKG